MEKIFDHKDTIAALCTPSGQGAIAVIRVSGSDAFSVCDLLFRGKKIAEQPSHTVVFGRLYDEEGLVDEVVITVFRGPRSFTGEDTAEISCHGSGYIVRRILNTLFKQGARAAKPGEFTLRAFLNGRLDLTQAEAVADLIASESKTSHEIALKQMRGGFSDELQNLRTQLIDFAALIELELDFSEEDVAFADREKFTELLKHIQTMLSALIKSFEYGNVIREGVGVAIVGKPNAGKSSLLNTLLNEERAIVSDIPGTTRDSIEETLIIDGILFRFIDTAGLRHTEDVIESIGIRKAKEKAAKADIILYLFDKNDATPEEVIDDIRQLYGGHATVILVQTKTDLTGGFREDDFITALNAVYPKLVGAITAVSVMQSETIQNLKGLLAWTVQEMAPSVGSIVTNSRHLEALQKAQEHLAAVRLGMEQNIGNDLLAHDIHFALRYLGEITGLEIDVDRDILGTIFGRFCIGK